MARIFCIKQLGALHNQDVINLWWYRSEAPLLPEPDDLQVLHDSWMTTVWGALDNIYSNEYALKQVIVQGYRDTFEKSPYLPLIVDHEEVGAVASPSGPPIQCAVLSARLEPAENGYRGTYPGPYARTPVRRGYWAISGMLDAWFLNTGLLQTAFLSTANAVDVQNAAKASLAEVVTGFASVPIKVSQPPAKTNLRGYAFVKDAKFATYVSARVSRKVGRGSR